MNCENAEQLIPLYVEADLDTAALQQVTEHLATCDSCRNLATEFQASQWLLHTAVLPTFDEATLTRMRTMVQDEIARTVAPPTLAGWWQSLGTWKVAVAAAALLLCASSLTFYPQFTAKQASGVSVVGEPPTSDEACCGTGSVRDLHFGQGLAVSKPGRARPSYRNRLTRRQAEKPQAPAVEQASSVATATVLPALAVAESPPEDRISAPEPEMLRMEIQTADPNIKIIWLTPKDSIAAQRNSAAESK